MISQRLKVSLSAPRTFKACLRWLLWRHVVRYEYEMCQLCGKRVGPHTGSWWVTDDILWWQVVGDMNVVLCPPCFTEMADEKGMLVFWEARQDLREKIND